jgi:hypothetical protein
MLPFIFIHSIYFISFCSDHSVIVILTIEDKTVIALTYINCSANNLKCECSLETRSCLVVDTLSVDKNLDVEEGGGVHVLARHLMLSLLGLDARGNVISLQSVDLMINKRSSIPFSSTMNCLLGGR